MSVKVRAYRKGRWEVDIRIEFPNGESVRERRVAPTSARGDAVRWAKAREHELLFRGPMAKAAGPPALEDRLPTFAEFVPRFMKDYVVANRMKPSGISAKSSILRHHLLPALGSRPLDAIKNEDVQQLKGALRQLSPKTVNNVLSVLNTLLKTAVSWDVLPAMPCSIKLLKAPQEEAAFHDFGEYARLHEAAARVDPRANLCVLLGGDAGLRCGEIMALEWSDLDLAKRQMKVQRSDWKGHVTVPKGGRGRVVPLTSRLAEALAAHQPVEKSKRVLVQRDGSPLSQKIVQVFLRKAADLAGLENDGVHVLRHYAGRRIMPGRMADRPGTDGSLAA